MREGFGSRIVQSPFFARLKERAVGYLRDPDKLRDLIQRGRSKAGGATGEGPVAGIWQSVLTLLRLLRAYARREYTDVPWQTLGLIVAGILYFVTPIDLIPDFIIGLGYLDDAAVLAWIVNAVRSVLDDFSTWESTYGR